MVYLKNIFSKKILLGVILAALFFRFALYVGTLPVIRRSELSLVDARYRFFPDKFKSDNSPVVIVAIDDESYEYLPDVWPWPRSYYARLIKNLKNAGANTVVLDLVFDKIRSDFPEGDSAFHDVLEKSKNVILGGKILVKKQEHALDVEIVYHEGEAELVLPHNFFLKGDSSNWALTDIYSDIDGIVRDYFFRRRIAEDGQLYPSLALKAYNISQKDTLTEYSDPDFKIAYPGGAGSFQYISFYQVIDDSTFWTRDEQEWGEANDWYYSLLEDEVFRDKIVLVGATMAELHDIKYTPYSVKNNTAENALEVPGVEVHAAALHTLLNNYHIKDAPPFLVYPAFALLCLMLFVLGMRTKFWIYFSTVLFIIMAWIGASFYLFKSSDLLVPVATPLLCIIFTAAGQISYLFYLEQMRRKEITGMFGHYVPREVVRELIKSPEKMKLGGEKRELAVLFTDIEGFTSISENLEPELLVELLNEYLTEMTDIIHANKGVIDKYEGDLIMAEFGIPLVNPDHSLCACRAALTMQKRLCELREKWAEQNKPLLKARTGIGTGQIIFGNMGSNQAFDYTVMGDEVNLASRLEGANKNYGTCILINELTYSRVKYQMIAREMDLLKVKGKNNPVRCYHLMCEGNSPEADKQRKIAGIFSEGINLYRKQQWDEAITEFNKVLDIDDDDTPSFVYIKRCREYRKKTPGSDWDGVYVMKTK